MSFVRPLHYVFKVGDRTRAINFYKDILGMKVLRHEEFEEGCKATCNGPYDGKWSKTMIGYGPEDSHFVLEIVYNYGIGRYTLGNDFLGLTIKSSEALQRAKQQKLPLSPVNEVLSPDGYKFTLLEGSAGSEDPVKKIVLGCSDLAKTLKYWSEIVGLQTLQAKDPNSLLFTMGGEKYQLEFQKVGASVDHATANGRIAFSCPTSQLVPVEEKVRAEGYDIKQPLVSLDTPGKATVQVVILLDPDGHEICFVGDEAFRELSQVDPQADKLLQEAINADKSNEWFSKKGLNKSEM